MKGEIREIDFRREAIPDGAGGEIAGYSIRIWVEGPEEGDETLALTLQGPRDGVDGDLSRILMDEPIGGWLELLMGNR